MKQFLELRDILQNRPIVFFLFLFFLISVQRKLKFLLQMKRDQENMTTIPQVRSWIRSRKGNTDKRTLLGRVTKPEYQLWIR